MSTSTLLKREAAEKEVKLLLLAVLATEPGRLIIAMIPDEDMHPEEVIFPVEDTLTGAPEHPSFE